MILSLSVQIEINWFTVNVIQLKPSKTWNVKILNSFHYTVAIGIKDVYTCSRSSKTCTKLVSDVKPNFIWTHDTVVSEKTGDNKWFPNPELWISTAMYWFIPKKWEHLQWLMIWTFHAVMKCWLNAKGAKKVFTHKFRNFPLILCNFYLKIKMYVIFISKISCNWNLIYR